MPPPPPVTKGLSVRTTGLVIAAGVFLIGAGVLGLLAVRGGFAGTGPGNQQGRAAPIMPPTPVDITGAGLQNAGRARVQFVDRNDPTRVVGYLEWAALNPTGAGKATVTEPRAVIYLRDGRTLNVAASTGVMSYPAGRIEQTESGVFQGGVTISMTEQPAGMGGGDEAARAVGAVGGAPALRLFTPTLAFNVVLGEVRADEAFRVSSEQFELAGRGLRLVGDQVASSISAEIDHTEYAWLALDRRGLVKAKPEQPAAAAKPKPPAGPPKESFYGAALRDRVVVRRRNLTVKAESLEAWARLLDNTLPATAIGGAPKAADDRSASDPRVGPGAGPKPPVQTFLQPAAPPPPPLPPPPAPPKRSAPIPGEPESLFTGQDDPNLVIVTWAGPLVVAPLASRPSGPLDGEELAAAFTGGQPGGEMGAVEVTDSDLGAHASAARLGYGATSRTAWVKSDPTRPDDVARLGLTGKGEFLVSDARLNLGSGVGVARGYKKLIAGDSTEAHPRSIEADGQTDFVLTTRNGWLGDKLREVIFQAPEVPGRVGGVLARDGASTFAARSARAEFIGAAQPGGAFDGQLSRLVAEGAVKANDDGGGGLMGNRLELAFEPSPTGRGADPTTLVVEGGVRGERDGWVISGEPGSKLTANLERDERNNVQVKDARVEGGAKVEGQGVVAKADQIRVDVPAQLIDFLGRGEGAPGLGQAGLVTLERDGGIISGPQMQLNGHREELFVFGPGALDYRTPVKLAPATRPSGGLGGGTGAVESPLESRAPEPAAERPQNVQIVWTRSMQFGNVDGRAECVGGVVARSKPSEDEEDTLRAERIVLAFSPGKTVNAPVLDGDPAPAAPPPRRLLRAEVIGESNEREGGARASIESRRFAPAGAAITAIASPAGGGGEGGAERVIERLLHIEGDRIIDDEELLKLSVPGPGRLLVDDRRAPPAKAADPSVVQADPGAAALPADLSGARGTTLFRWGVAAVAAGGNGAGNGAGNGVGDGAGGGGGLEFTRGDGLVKLFGGVKIFHRPAPGEPVTTINADLVQATVRSAATPGRSEAYVPGKQAELLSAAAIGNVTARGENGAQLTADRAMFDALRQSIDASADAPNRVLFAPPNSGTPVQARRLLWEIAASRWTIQEPAPIVAPR